MKDHSRRRAVTVALTHLVFAFREEQRLTEGVAARRPNQHYPGAVLEDGLLSDARKVRGLMEEWKDALVGLGVGPLADDLNRVNPWMEAAEWARCCLPAGPLRAKVQRLAGRDRDVTSEAGGIAERIGAILHTLNLRTHDTHRISELIG